MGKRGNDAIESIVPEGFVERYDGADTVAEALERAEKLPTTTPADELPRCERCDSTQLKPRALKYESEQRTGEGRYNCEYCGHTVDGDAPGHTGPRAPFNWVREPCDADKRTTLTPPLAGLDDKTLTAVALCLREPWGDGGRSYRDIARYLPYSRTWVGHRVRDWREGGRRDLVPDPTTVTDTTSGAGAVATDGGRRRWDAYGGR